MSLSRHLALDARIREALSQSHGVTHALAYGSFTQGTADHHSDLEYWAFLDPASAATFETEGWLTEHLKEPILLFLTN